MEQKGRKKLMDNKKKCSRQRYKRIWFGFKLENDTIIFSVMFY